MFWEFEEGRGGEKRFVLPFLFFFFFLTIDFWFFFFFF